MLLLLKGRPVLLVCVSALALLTNFAEESIVVIAVCKRVILPLRHLDVILLVCLCVHARVTTVVVIVMHILWLRILILGHEICSFLLHAANYVESALFCCDTTMISISAHRVYVSVARVTFLSL